MLVAEPDPDPGAGPAAGLEAEDAAAALYARVLADEPGEVVMLDKASHAAARVLWQQRFFTQALGAPLLCWQCPKPSRWSAARWAPQAALFLVSGCPPQGALQPAVLEVGILR